MVGSRNYIKQLNALQSEWEPLDPEYVQDKLEAGYPARIWALTGQTFRVLSIATRIMGRFRSGNGRTVPVSKNTGYFVQDDWTIVSPSASGWPELRSGETKSQFKSVNRKRPFINRISDEAKALTYRKLNESVGAYFRRVFLKP